MRDFSRLLRPQTIAVLGGSWAASVIEQCQRMGFAGQLWPVHPSRESIGGVRCYRGIEQLPSAPDVCFVGVNRFATVELVGQLAKLGAGGVVCFASGFSEAAAEDASGVALQRQLLAAAGNMPLLGPNCYGLINYLDGALLWPDQHGGQRVDRGVAIITQSSNIAINLTMQTRGLPIAYVMTAGNQAQTGLAEMGQALLADERVTALGLYIEGFGDPRGFEALAMRARQLGKGIVALKAGRSQQSREAMVSHTSSLAGSDAAGSALLARLGIARLNSLPALLESLKLLHVMGPLPGNAIASMSCSGGEAGLMADSVRERDLHYPSLTDLQQQALRAALGPLVALANPLDYHTYIWNDLAALTATFTAMLSSAADLTFLVIDLPRADICAADSWLVAIDALRVAQSATGARVALLATLPENIPEPLARDLVQSGLLVCAGIEEALDATEAAAFIARCYRSKPQPPLLLANAVTKSTSPAGELQVLLEADAKARLQQAGLQVPQSATVESVAELLPAAQQLGYPLVLKGTGVAHKSDVGAVAVNLRNDQALSAAADKMQNLTSTFLVEQYIDDSVAELLVGIVKDPACGFLLTLGAGGVWTELLADTQSLLLPVSADQIDAALRRLKIAPILDGYRAAPAVARSALIDAIVNLCLWFESCADSVTEVEINPLLCTADSAVAVDALIGIRAAPC